MNDGDESIGLAGWLFADLLLALMFVFLAIGFVIEADGLAEEEQVAAATTTTTTTTTTTLPPSSTTTTVKICPGIEPLGANENRQRDLRLDYLTDGTAEEQQQLRDEINDFLNDRIGIRLREQGIDNVDPSSVTVGYMLVFGGTGGGSISSGKARAQQFLDGIGALMPERFPGGSDTLGRAFYHSGSAREIEIEYFPRVPVIDGDC
jgi:hypothetical protein